MIASHAPQRGGARDLAYDLATFAATLTLDRLPGGVAEAGLTNVRDTLACAWAGTTAPGISELLSIVREWGGKPEASIFGTRDRVPAHHAAWVNSAMSHARDYDDTHDGAVLHAGVSIVPAALAAAEVAGPRATGADILSGIVAGLEVMCRLGVGTTMGIVESGFIYSALLGYFAATAAASRVLRFDAEQTVNALGIAYSQASGTHQVTRDAAMTKRMQPAFAAKAALVSVRMTQAGIRGVRNVFEGEDGLFRTYLRGGADAATIRAGLGEAFELVNLSYKPYPCCRFTHAAIDAALQLRSEHPVDLRGGGEIVVGVNRQAFEAVCTPVDVRKKPRTVVEAQFSIPYTVACALVDGAVGLEHFSDRSLERSDILRISERVTCVADPEIERRWGRSVSPARLSVPTAAGTVSAWVEHPRGHARVPMSDDDFRRKTRNCLAVAGVAEVDAAAQALARAVDALPHAPDGSRLLQAMQAPPATEPKRG